jgi:general secretion pathway protein G
MRRGFTMIELVFVIVILGILASIAIPRLAASRDDARAVTIKQDIGTLSQAVPAWYQGQREVSIVNAASLDLALWNRTTANQLAYTYTDGAEGKVEAILCAAEIGANAKNITDGSTDCDVIITNEVFVEDNSTTFTGNPGKEPWLKIGLTPKTTGIVKMLVDDMKISNQSVPMAGRRVKHKF